MYTQRQFLVNKTIKIKKNWFILKSVLWTNVSEPTAGIPTIQFTVRSISPLGYTFFAITNSSTTLVDGIVVVASGVGNSLKVQEYIGNTSTSTTQKSSADYFLSKSLYGSISTTGETFLPNGNLKTKKLKQQKIIYSQLFMILKDII